jgi:hypothetical protein
MSFISFHYLVPRRDEHGVYPESENYFNFAFAALGVWKLVVGLFGYVSIDN